MQKYHEILNDPFNQIFIEQFSQLQNIPLNNPHKCNNIDFSVDLLKGVIKFVNNQDLKPENKKLQTSQNKAKVQTNSNLKNINVDIFRSSISKHQYIKQEEKNITIVNQINMESYILKKSNFKKKIVRNTNLPKFLFHHFFKQLKNNPSLIQQQFRKQILRMFVQIQQWRLEDKVKNVVGLVHLIRVLGQQAENIHPGASVKMRKLLHFVIKSGVNKDIINSKSLKHKLSYLISTKAYRLRTFCSTLVRRIQLKSSESVNIQRLETIKFKNRLVEFRNIQHISNYQHPKQKKNLKQLHYQTISQENNQIVIQQPKIQFQIKKYNKKIMKFMQLRTYKNSNIPKFLFNNLSKAYRKQIKDQSQDPIAEILMKIQDWKAQNKITNTPKLKHLSAILSNRADKICKNASSRNRQFMHKLIRKQFATLIISNPQLKKKNYVLFCSKIYAIRCYNQKLVQRIQCK